MAEISYTQKSFLGGEWSPYFQGRTDHPKYVQALNLSRNGLPIEEGTWLRRPGSRLKAPTYQNKPGRLYPIEFAADQPYDVEFTDGWLRFYSGHNLVYTVDGPQVVTAVSTANPAVITLASAVTWATDDEIYFTFDASHSSGALPLRQRSFLVTKLSTTSFSLRDGLTLANIDGSTLSVAAGTSITASRVLRLATPYTSGSWATCRIVQNQNFGLVLNRAFLPYVLTIGPGTITGTAFATFQKVQFVDGPYIDPVNNSQLTFTGGTLTGPAAWDAGTAYHNGAVVQVGGLYYLYASSNGFPGVTSPVGVTPPSAGWYLVSASGAGAGINGSVTITASFVVWDATKPYNIDDYVSYSGANYRSLQQGNINKNPASQATYWAVVPAGTEVTGPYLTYGQTPGFQATDVGRQVRVWSQPPEWDPMVVYHTGDIVTYQDAVYLNGDPNTNNQTVNIVPGTSVNLIGNSVLVTGSGPGGAIVPGPVWNLQTSGNYEKWTGGVITAVSSAVAATILIEGSPLPIYSPTKSTPLTVPEPATLWRLGVYSDTTAYPSCGSFYEGRFWFGGAVPNRFDTSKSQGFDQNGAIFMAPTLEDGTVTDANGISYTLQGRDLNEIFWLEPDHNGIMCGTLAGEWLIQASTLSDPITPTSIQAKRVTKYGCANIEPRRTGISLVFIQKFRRRVMEFLADVFTGRYVAPHLNEAAKHLTTNGVSEIGYQEELAPVLWARTGETTSVTTSTRTARTIAAACSIQSFVPGFTPTSGQTASIDWATNKFVANENSNTEVYKADMISGVTDVASTTVASLTSVANDGVGFSLVNDLKGGVYTYHGTAGNYFAPVLKITDALAFVYTHGSASAGGPPTTDGIGEFIGGAVASANADWLVTCEWSLLANHNIQVNRCDTGAYVVGNNSGGNNYLGLGNHAWYMDEFGTAANSPQVGAGAALAGGNLATAYVVGMLATNLGFYCVGIYDAVPSTPSWFIAKIGTLVPGDIDPDWAGLSFGDATNGLSAQGCAVDHFDNGIITNVAVGLATAYNAGTTYAAGAVVGDTVSKNYVSLVSSNTGHTPSSSPTFWRPVQMHYIMKYNTGPYSADGINNGTGGAAGVMWKVPVNTIVNQYGTGDQSLVKHGLFAFVEAHPTLASTSIAYIIDTLTGTYGTINIPGIAFNGSQAWDDTTNSIVFPGAFDTGVAGHPTALNSTTTYTGMWGRLYLGTTTNVPTGYNFTTTTTITPGGLIGATYRRVSAFTTEAPAFVGWHRHDLGHSRGPVSIGVTPSGDSSGLLDNLDMVTSDGSNYFVEGLTQLFDEDDALIDAWFVDGGVIPDSAYEDTVSVLGVRFTGLNWFIGKTIAVVAFGLDLGDYVVDANGTVFVPYGSGTAPVSFDYTVAGAGRYLFTAAYIAANLLTTPGRNGSIAYGNGYMPCCAGYTYTSQGQLLRPSSPETSGTRAGPAMGKKRRSHLFVGLFHNTIGVQVGTDFANKLLPANFKDDGDTLFPPDQMYSGTWRDTVESDYDFDSMITWQILRPYPASVVSIGAMLKTQDV